MDLNMEDFSIGNKEFLSNNLVSNFNFHQEFEGKSPWVLPKNPRNSAYLYLVNVNFQNFAERTLKIGRLRVGEFQWFLRFHGPPTRSEITAGIGGP